MSEPRDTVETAMWNDRELMLRIYYQVVETNGTVRQHDREIYGDEHLSLTGLKQIALENTAYRERMRVGMRIAMSIAGALTTILTAILVLIVEHVM